MNALDFLSQSPQNFIFHNSANKTNLGGILSLIYLIIIIIISLYYFAHYIINDKYKTGYFFFYHPNGNYNNPHEREPIISDELLPNFNFIFKFHDIYSFDSHNFFIGGFKLIEYYGLKIFENTAFNTTNEIIIDNYTEESTTTKTYILRKNRKIGYDYKFVILYQCQLENCSDINRVSIIRN